MLFGYKQAARRCILRVGEVLDSESPSSASIEHDRRLMELIMLLTAARWLVTVGNKAQLVSYIQIRAITIYLYIIDHSVHYLND